MTKIIDGRKIKDELLIRIKEEVLMLPFVPVFCDILVGNDPASLQYVEMKAKVAESVGIHFHQACFPKEINNEDLLLEIDKINKIPNMCGIIVQLPLPESLDRRKILDAIDSNFDVDCLGSLVSNNFYKGNTEMAFPTALACMKLLECVDFPLKEKSFVVLGQGELVGKPVSFLLKLQGYKVETVDSNTLNKEKIIKEADVIISGIGQGKYLKGEMIKDGAVVIDAGTSESGSGIVGDVDLDSMQGIASFISPVPGGVGPVTIAMLLGNILKVAQKRNEFK